jgi:transcriptional regulator with XRE-family HTH domain
MALGKILRETREQQGYSVAQVAEATHMMIQIVEDLEREDFHRIAAPIYGRGFVKLYAEFLRIDAEPLVKEFNEIYSGSRRPSIATRVVRTAPEPAAPPPPARPGPRRAVQPASPSVSAATPPPPEAPAAPENEMASAAPREAATAPSARSSDVAGELDDLFGPLPASARAARTERQPAYGGNRPKPGTPAQAALQPAETDDAVGEGNQRSIWMAAGAWCGQAVDATARGWQQIGRRLGGGLPAGWRGGPVLIAAGASLLVIAICVVIIALAGRRPAPAAVEPADASPAAPLNITAILPPPEPYVD